VVAGGVFVYEIVFTRNPQEGVVLRVHTHLCDSSANQSKAIVSAYTKRYTHVDARHAHICVVLQTIQTNLLVPIPSNTSPLFTPASKAGLGWLPFTLPLFLFFDFGSTRS
jgi:hypothetical protein